MLSSASQWIRMYRIQHFLFILHTESAMANLYWWHKCTCFPQTAVTTANTSVGLPPVWILMLWATSKCKQLQMIKLLDDFQIYHTFSETNIRVIWVRPGLHIVLYFQEQYIRNINCLKNSTEEKKGN